VNVHDDDVEEVEKTELLEPEVARFPRARLTVVSGPDKGAEVALEGQQVVVGSEEGCQLQLSDPAVSRRHFELSGGPGGYRLRDLRSTNGVFVEGVQVLEAKLVDKVRLKLGRTELKFEPETRQVSWPLSHMDHFGECYGQSASMRRVFALLEKAAKVDSPVVLEGEPGCGRESLARSLHQESARADGPFVPIDFAALTEPLFESDLFGREMGHLTAGVRHRAGALEEAHGGTVFLDEIAELPLPLQSRLFKALDEGFIRRVGGKVDVPIDVRVVASSRKDLEAEVKAGRFLEELYYRVSVIRLRVPALRERLEDVPGLAARFQERVKGAPPLTEDKLQLLQRHDWPGNVRELRNVVERLCAMPDLGANALARALGRSAGAAEEAAAASQVELARQLVALPYHDAKERVLESFERSYFTEHLKAANGVVTRAAQRMGLPRQSVHRMLRRLGLGSGEE